MFTVGKNTQELETKADAAAEGEFKDTELNGLTVRRNFKADRLQLIFDDIPPENVRAILKRHGFRWSPRFSAWQRKLTTNAIYALKHYVFKDLDGTGVY